MSLIAEKRLQKEFKKMLTGELPPGIKLAEANESDVMKPWSMDISLLHNNALYAGKTYRLSFKFNRQYPIEPPEVKFITATDREIPMHPHIYSNGVICLDLLSAGVGGGWSPVQSVETVCVSIQSMLEGNNINQRPEGDDQFVYGPQRRIKDINFVYDDPTV
ncbi:ubiquitin-conjugating enzyme/RWD-like protein [Pyronema domesticum]|uniref:Similar to Ubiquitin-conjugating enzyme E2 W acc. no. Q28FC1 n=1 Tax=Pyronema omphalodes (strain CBS 100304) TaxID=1076935 RepID=U4KUD3_PYROM|nr:ubiquitin-conjugating enzyme/RWD-like protein [Pyronema domesticum]CCX04607.1 Similar to Ubiquitin-conjugating enzyme E2 W; acc. no. Q28FC1 [Pyronema omphalodes CBS 100304]